MANAPAKADSSVSRLRELCTRVVVAIPAMLRSALGNRRRTAAVLSTVLLLATFTGLAWMLLVRSAAPDGEDVTLADALLALDEERLDDARSIVSTIRQRPDPLPEDYGGTAYVLGALRAQEAGELSPPSRSKAAFLIASRYLREAAGNGFPLGREAEGWLLFARSLVESEQYAAAAPVLERALAANPQASTPIHRMLAIANLRASSSDLAAAKKYSDLELGDRTLAPHERAEALLRRGEILLQLGELGEVESLVKQLPLEVRQRPPAKMLAARLLMAQADELDAAEQIDGPQGDVVSMRRSAIGMLRDLQAASGQESELARSAQLLIGQCYARLPGEADAALDQFARISRLYPNSAEGVAASLAQAELLQEVGRVDDALAAYTTTLRLVGDPTAYHNRWLPLASLRKRVFAANDALMDEGKFREALSMLDGFGLAFDKVDALWQRASIHRAWGERLVEAAAMLPAEESKTAGRDGRRQFRNAARIMEAIGELRLAEPEHADDLWRAAENYLNGHSASNAARVLVEYLAHEAVTRRPQALVKLGLAYLTIGDLDRSIAALEECIELYDRDAAVYDARIFCARAYMEKDDVERVETLLRANLSDGGLTPASREWRDSLLQLGRLYHAQGQYPEAIRLLEEYVERYGEEPEALLARYLVAQSNRHAAQEPLDKLAVAITENERIKHRTTALTFLNSAAEHFSYVQRALTLQGASGELDPLEQAVLRNCYMLRGDVLFSMRAYEEALDVFRNASSLYQNDPIALNAYLQIAWCHRRLEQLQEARGAVEQAKMVLGRLPEDADFHAATGMDRQQWRRVLDDISQW